MPKGTRFGRLQVVREVEPKYNSGIAQRRFKCKCDCGNNTTVLMSGLRFGKTTSCGCYHRELCTKHGLATHPLFKTWQAMVSRCHNKRDKAYPNYGARGINVCKEWRGSEGVKNFVAWAEKTYKEGKTLDRRDNNKGYTPDNCRWVSYKKQNRNRRWTIMVNYRGKRMPLAEALEKFGNSTLKLTTVTTRVTRCKWPVEEAINKNVGAPRWT